MPSMRSSSRTAAMLSSTARSRCPGLAGSCWNAPKSARPIWRADGSRLQLLRPGVLRQAWPGPLASENPREEFMTFAYLARLVLTGAALSLAPFAGASAQTGTIRFIVGLAPGGAVDPYARIISEHMAKTLGQTIIVENKPGATGNI